jgi:hypothetical protein
MPAVMSVQPVRAASIHIPTCCNSPISFSKALNGSFDSRYYQLSGAANFDIMDNSRAANRCTLMVYCVVADKVSTPVGVTNRCNLRLDPQLRQ